MKMAVSGDVTPCGLVEIYNCFMEYCHPHNQHIPLSLITEAAEYTDTFTFFLLYKTSHPHSKE
jgi:hypothetical protein